MVAAWIVSMQNARRWAANATHMVIGLAIRCALGLLDESNQPGPTGTLNFSLVFLGAVASSPIEPPTPGCKDALSYPVADLPG
jgi:Mn2+/Fe2+ NRAMP family transporter